MRWSLIKYVPLAREGSYISFADVGVMQLSMSHVANTSRLLTLLYHAIVIISVASLCLAIRRWQRGQAHALIHDRGIKATMENFRNIANVMGSLFTIFLVLWYVWSFKIYRLVWQRLSRSSRR